jgi:AcrR family transcriptional regulator
LFAERGYQATTRQIADRAGVSPDLIFRYFETKEKLLFESVLAPLLDAVDEVNRQWVDDPALPNYGRREAIRRFTAGFYTFIDENKPIARAMVHLFVEDSTEGVLEHLRQKLGATLATMAAPVDDYLTSQGLRHPEPALQLRIMLLIIGAIALFLPNTYSADPDVPDRDAIIDELSTFIYNGLRDAPEATAASQMPDGPKHRTNKQHPA